MAVRRVNIFFILTLLLEFFILLYDILARQLVGGHDAFLYFASQYYFLNNAAFSGEIPHWVPYLTMGSPGNQIYCHQAGLFQNILLLSGPLWQGTNFLPLFHIGIFIEKLILLIGTWLLGRRFFDSSATVFFITTAVLGSCLWMYEPGFNLHFYYALPLILHFGHKFLESGRWRYCFLAGNLLAIQTIGNTLYFFPVTTLVIALYFLFYLLSHFSETKGQLKNINWDGRSLSCFISIGLSLSVIFLIASFWKEDIVIRTHGRNVDGTVAMETFLTYGVFTDAGRWGELIHGISWNFDQSLYIGLVALPMVVIGLIFNRKIQLAHLYGLIVFLLFFIYGTFVSAAAYYVWPFMPFFRHLGNVVVLVKFFGCFLAGLGFEYCFTQSPRTLFSRSVFLIFSIILAVLSFNFFHLSGQEEFLKQFSSLREFEPILTKHPFTPEILSAWLRQSAVYAFAGSVLFGLLSLGPNPRFRSPLLALALVAHIANLYGYYGHNSQIRMSALTAGQSATLDFQKVPFQRERQMNVVKASERLDIIKNLHAKPISFLIHLFLLEDRLDDSLRTDYWLHPFDDFLRAYGNQTDNNPSLPFKGLDARGRLHIDARHPATLKLTGVAEDKIQFFSTAYGAQNEEIAKYITHPDYRGDLLFVSSGVIPANARKIPAWPQGSSLSDNQRLDIPYKVTRFDSNHIELNVHMPPSLKTAWLFYSDVWHPQWKATVNNKPVLVFKANLAFKAVPLGPEAKTVHLYFKSGVLNFLQSIIAVNSLFWLIVVLGITGRLCFREGSQSPKN